MENKLWLAVSLIFAAFVSNNFACWRGSSSEGTKEEDSAKVGNASCFSPCGMCGNNISVEMIVQNLNQTSPFEFTTTVVSPQRPLIYFLEKAADQNWGFLFSAKYYNDSLGYFITTMNGLEGFSEGNTYWYWQILNNTAGAPIPLGVSSYVPSDGESVLFNFTSWQSGEDH